MFQEENNILTQSQGRIEVICGSMFSGKTEELIRRLKRARIARQRVSLDYFNVDACRKMSVGVNNELCCNSLFTPTL